MLALMPRRLPWLRWPLVLGTAVLPSIVVALVPDTPPAWLGPVAAASLAALMAWSIDAARHQLGTLVLGGLLAVVAPQVTLRALDTRSTATPADDITLVDLTRGARLPTDAALARVRGYLRPSWSLDEYRVVTNRRPDQNEPAPFRLIPLLDSPDAESTDATQLVVVRLAGDADTSGALPREFVGVVRPLPDELTHSLVGFAGGRSPATMDAYLLDTAGPTSPTEALIATLIAAFVLLAAAATLAAATKQPAATESNPLRKPS